MKKVGIVVDNHKLETYKVNLEKKGFKIDFEGALTKETTALTLQVADTRVQEVARLCQKLERLFKNKN